LLGLSEFALPSSALAAPDMLTLLGRKLATLRAAPVGTPSKEVCPTGTKDLLHLSRQEIRSALKEPDYCDPPNACPNAQQWVYLIGAPMPPGQLGGGTPALVFGFDKGSSVSTVRCNFSR